MIATLVFTDGRRDYIERTLASYDEMVTGNDGAKIIVNDCMDPAYADWLEDAFPEFEILNNKKKLGFNGTIQNAWHYLDYSLVGDSYIFHLEDDFTFNEAINLEDMYAVLLCYPNLIQMALKRQPWNAEENEAGGIVERSPASYTEVKWGDFKWTEHTMFFTTNPSLYHRSLTERGWPQAERSEGLFTLGITESNPDARFAYWGGKFDPPKVEHIGFERVGTGY